MDNNIPNGFGSIGKSNSDNNAENSSAQNNATQNSSANTSTNTGTSQTERPIYQNVNLGNNGNYKNPNPAPKPVKKSGGIENFLGNNVMGLFASALVIVGLILLVTAASEYITDLIKVILIYLISFTILGIGLFVGKKSKTGFSMSLAGCGVGAVYISIFMTYGYFGLFNVLVMFVAAAIWSIIVFFIGGVGASMFHITGQCGLLISLCYGMSEIVRSQIDNPEIFALALLLFYVCVTIFYAVLDKEGPKWEAVVVFIMNLFGLIFMFATYASVLHEYEDWQQFVLVAVLILYSLWLSFISYFKFGKVKPVAVDATTGEVLKKSGTGIGWAIYFCFNNVITCFCLKFLCEFRNADDWVIPLIGLLYVITAWLLIGILRKKDDTIFIVCSVFLLLWAVNFIQGLETVADLFGVGLLVLPFLFMAILMKSRSFMAMNLICVVMFAFHDAQYPALYAMLMMLFILSSAITVILSKKFTNALYKIALLGASTVFIERIPRILIDQFDVENFIAKSIAFWLYAVLIVVCTFLILKAKKIKEGYDYSLHMIINAMNIIAMLAGASLVQDCPNLAIHIINLIVLLILVCINIPDMTKNKNGSNALYSVIKITLYAVVLVRSFELDAFMITLACLIVSIVSIIIGFVAERKSVRLYGLILSIISICKLLLFDISFDSDILRAVVVIICGVIAFAICLVYNTVNKKIEGEHKVDQ